jgi:hypothetical protein
VSEFTMPTVALGDLVFYYAHEGAKPAAAFVTDASSRTLTLSAMAPNYGLVEKISVHHKDDPGLEEFTEWKRYGTWDFKPRKDAIISEKVAILEKKVADLEARKSR